jgi:hypothetical protein
MRFGNINNQKGNPTAILLEEFIESGSLPPEGWSSVAAKDQHHRLLFVQYRELNPFTLVDL